MYTLCRLMFSEVRAIIYTITELLFIQTHTCIYLFSIFLQNQNLSFRFRFLSHTFTQKNACKQKHTLEACSCSYLSIFSKIQPNHENTVFVNSTFSQCFHSPCFFFSCVSFYKLTSTQTKHTDTQTHIHIHIHIHTHTHANRRIDSN